MQDRVVGELDAVNDPSRVEDVDAALGLGVVHDRGDLEAAGDDQLAVVRPDRRRIVERIPLAGELEQQLEPGGAATESFGELLAQVVTPPLAGLVVGNLGLACLRPPAVPNPGPLPGGVYELERMRRAVAELGEARGGLAADRGLDRRLRLGVRGKECAELLHVRLACLGVRPAEAQELEKLLGGSGDEGGVAGREDVGLVPILRTKLHRHPARLPPRVVGLRVAAAVRESDQGRNGVALEVDGAAEFAGLGRGGKAALAPGALGVQRPTVGVGPVDGIRGVDQLLVEVAALGHRRHRIRPAPPPATG